MYDQFSSVGWGIILTAAADHRRINILRSPIPTKLLEISRLAILQISIQGAIERMKERRCIHDAQIVSIDLLSNPTVKLLSCTRQEHFDAP